MTNTDDTPRTYLGQTASTWRELRNRCLYLVAAPVVVVALTGHGQDAGTGAQQAPVAIVGVSATDGRTAAGQLTGTHLRVSADPAGDPVADEPEEYVADVPAPAAADEPAEDSPQFSCMTNGNRICGPGSGSPAGCYHGGVLVIPWSNYTHPEADQLYGQFTAPC